MRGQSIIINLLDGTANGILSIVNRNWNGQVIIAPRAQLQHLSQQKEVTATGIYVLVGDDSNNVGKEQIYIGESDNVFIRLTQHNVNPEKDFWSRTIIATSTHLTRAHTLYLEARLLEIARAADRVTISNRNNPSVARLPAPDVDYAENFLDNLLLILNVVNFRLGTPVPTASILPHPTNIAATATSISKSPILVANSSDYSAEAQEVDGQFIVLKDSKIRKNPRASLGKTYVELREQMLNEAKLADLPNESSYIFTTDVLFSSPSAAGCVVSGMSVNGREFWKIKETGQTYNQWDQDRINSADASE